MDMHVLCTCCIASAPSPNLRWQSPAVCVVSAALVRLTVRGGDRDAHICTANKGMHGDSHLQAVPSEGAQMQLVVDQLTELVRFFSQ